VLSIHLPANSGWGLFWLPGHSCREIPPLCRIYYSLLMDASNAFYVAHSALDYATHKCKKTPDPYPFLPSPLSPLLMRHNIRVTSSMKRFPMHTTPVPNSLFLNIFLPCVWLLRKGVNSFLFFLLPPQDILLLIFLFPFSYYEILPPKSFFFFFRS